MSKIILGYKLIDKKYERAAVEIVKVYTESGFNNGATSFRDIDDLDDEYDFQSGSICETLLREAGVLELWFRPHLIDPKPEAWYDEAEMKTWLKQCNYADDIADELAPIMVKNYNLAYEKGYERGILKRKRL